MEAVVDAESFSFFLRRWNESARTLKPDAMLLLLLFFLFRLNVLTTLNVLNLCILLGVLEYCQLKVLQCLPITLQLLHLYLHLRLPLCYCLKWCFLNIILGLDLFEDRCSSHPLVSFIFILLPLFNPEIKVNFLLTFFLPKLVQLLFTFFLANLVQLLNWNLLKEFFFFFSASFHLTLRKVVERLDLPRSNSLQAVLLACCVPWLLERFNELRRFTWALPWFVLEPVQWLQGLAVDHVEVKLVRLLIKCLLLVYDVVEDDWSVQRKSPFLLECFFLHSFLFCDLSCEVGWCSEVKYVRETMFFFGQGTLTVKQPE